MRKHWKWLGAGLTAVVVLALASTMPTSEAKKPDPKPKPPPESPAPRVICFGQWKGARGWDPTALICTMDANGDNAFTVVQGGTLVSPSASWSPDGQWLGCYQREGFGIPPYDFPPYDRAIFCVRPDGTDEQMVVSYMDIDAYNRLQGKTSPFDLGSAGGISGAHWLPDGYMLISADVVYWDDSGNWYTAARLFKVKLDPQSGEERITQLMDEPGRHMDLCGAYWPFFKKIVFRSSRNSGDLFSLDPVTLEVHQITNFAGWPMYGFALNRAGTAMALTMDTPGRPVGANTDLWLLPVVPDPDGPPAQAEDLILLRGDPACQEKAVAWSPDGSQLLMNRSWPDGPEQIVVIDMTTDSETILAKSHMPLDASDWCPVAPSP